MTHERNTNNVMHANESVETENILDVKKNPKLIQTCGSSLAVLRFFL